MELNILQDQDGAEPTEVGSYFVSNYPPFSVWSKRHISAAEDALAESHAHRECPPLGLYLHIPFCRKRCTFCYFRVYTDKNARDVDMYVRALAREASLYKQYPALADRDLEYVYFGGGTPSFLSSDQINRLVERINEHWDWSKAKEVTFECEPGTLKKSKLETIKSIGVTRLSLGIEHFDDAVLEQGGRAHRSAESLQAFQWAREVGFPQINVDLIAGMVGDTTERWHDTIAKTLALEPDNVTIYQMEVPHNTVVAQEAKASGAATPVPGWNTKREWVAHAFNVFEDAGYRVSSAYTLVRADNRDGFVYRDSLWRGADLIPTGVASFGHVSGVHFQNVDEWEEYTQSLLDDGRLPISRAMPLTHHQLLIREIILHLKLGVLETAYFRHKFRADILDLFGPAFRSLVNEGMAEISGDAVRLTRAALLRVDGLVGRFYEPEYRTARYT